MTPGNREVNALPLLLPLALLALHRLVAARRFRDTVNLAAFAALQERQRLAQNLHDAVNQSLFSAGLIADVLPRLWERDQEQARKSLEDLRRLTRAAQAEMRAQRLGVTKIGLIGNEQFAD